jgi:tRNA modification GTPase
MVTPILKEFCRNQRFLPREMTLTEIRNPDSRELIDLGLVVLFEAPGSFTGEDVAEFHVHGSLAVMRELQDVLAAQPGLRPAEPGEFTRRAFENGKMDLTEVEGLADLIEAETKAQKRQALRQMEGALGVLYEGWRERLIQSLAYVEADIDFSEEDLPQGVLAHVWPNLADVCEEVSAHLGDGHRGERLRSGYRIVILGQPNVGKSSFLNALAKRDVAIVSEEAGTTRDVLEIHLDLGGFPVVVMDTAGLREAASDVEAEGIRRARMKAEDADLRLLIRDARDFDGGEGAFEGQGEIEGDLVLWNKADLVSSDTVSRIHEISGSFALSARQDTGLRPVLDAIEARVKSEIGLSETAQVTRLRHRQGLESCLSHLAEVAKMKERQGDPDLEIAAEELRLAARSLGRITGRVDVEDILDVIFRDFCIGK